MPVVFRFVVFLVFVTVNILAKSEQKITVKGKVVGQYESDYLYQLMVVNNHSKTGTFANADATFQITANKNDTILFSAAGYAIKKICFKDSAYKPVYTIVVRLEKFTYLLKEVEVYPVKKLDEVQKNIEELGVKSRETYKNVDALSSPFTFLYERFSRFEQSKRIVAELENEDRRKEVLKDLFRIYIKYDIINLSNEDFDDFIAYCNLSDEYIKTASKYDLVQAIKMRYEYFEKTKRPKYQYHYYEHPKTH